MSGLDVLLGDGVPSPVGSPCKLAKIMASLPDQYRSALFIAVETVWSQGGLSDADLAKLMREAGLSCSATTIGMHRRGVCTCPTER
jgi:hypothetical protein